MRPSSGTVVLFISSCVVGCCVHRVRRERTIYPLSPSKIFRPPYSTSTCVSCLPRSARIGQERDKGQASTLSSPRCDWPSRQNPRPRALLTPRPSPVILPSAGSPVHPIMNYKRHFFWANLANLLAFALGGGVWLLEIGFIARPPEDVSNLVIGTIIAKMLAYPTLAMTIAWLIFRFPLMPRCDRCGTRLGSRRDGTYTYVCPRCGTSYDTGKEVTGAGD